MKVLLLELRMFIAEKLLSWAYSVAPESHKDGEILREHIISYTGKVIFKKPVPTKTDIENVRLSRYILYLQRKLNQTSWAYNKYERWCELDKMEL